MKAGKISSTLPLAAMLLSPLGAFSQQIPQNAPAWELRTDDTILDLAVANNQVYIVALKNPSENWNWVPAPTSMPLIASVSGMAPNWTYQDATVDGSNGSLITLRFTSSTPKLELKSYWQARPGPGPVENWTTVQNQTGGTVNYNQSDIQSANLNIVADSTVTLARFNRCGVATSNHVGVLTDLLGPNQTIASQTRDTDDYYNGNNTQSLIPFNVFNVGDIHGLYIGYAWSFGVSLVTTGTSGTAISYNAHLWDSGSFAEADGKILNIPAIYLGTYQGDLDDGGNRFKKWFWDYKMPATIRNNTNEPLLEYIIPNDQAGVDSYFAQYNMKAWGGELAKIDIDWLLGVVPGDTATWFTDQIVTWICNPAEWPNGMTAGAIVHMNNQKLSLYMPHTYMWGDLGTQAARDAEKAALLSRYDDLGYDYYRSDGWCENNADLGLGPTSFQGGAFYLSHEGYMEVLDYMISNRPGFRYEHCSGGGTLKDFDTLQRVSVMTTEDLAQPDTHRKSIYSCQYSINPVQLKADIAIQGGPGSADDEAWVKYCLRTGFTGANMATSWGVPTPTIVAQSIAHWPLYKNYMRPILRGADVYHILPICDGINWDGMEYLNSSLGANGSGAVLLFKPSASAPDSNTIKLKGLSRSATYILTFQDRTNLNTSMSGADLMDNGISISGMSGSYASEILWINKDDAALLSPPQITQQPTSQTLATGSTVVFNTSATAGSASYQWSVNGTPLSDGTIGPTEISGSTRPTLVISGATAADAGSYTCAVTNSAGAAISNAATLAVSSTANVGRLINLSCRAQVGTGGNILIAGFVTGGAGTIGSQSLLIRASGPALTTLDVPGALPDPQLQLYGSNPDGSSYLIGTNDGWGGSSQIASAAAEVGAFAWNSASSHDAALLAALSGAHTAQISGQSEDSGVALVEVYDATALRTYTSTTPRLVNLSARVQVGTGSGILIAGFVIGGSTSMTVLIRASGPALAPFDISSPLPDPQLQIYQSNSDGSSVLLGSNIGWSGNAAIADSAATIGAFAWTDPTSADSAILLTLPPSAYTATVSGASGDVGAALVEVYEVP